MTIGGLRRWFDPSTSLRTGGPHRERVRDETPPQILRRCAPQDDNRRASVDTPRRVGATPLDTRPLASTRDERGVAGLHPHSFGKLRTGSSSPPSRGRGHDRPTPQRPKRRQRTGVPSTKPTSAGSPRYVPTSRDYSPRYEAGGLYSGRTGLGGSSPSLLRHCSGQVSARGSLRESPPRQAYRTGSSARSLRRSMIWSRRRAAFSNSRSREAAFICDSRSLTSRSSSALGMSPGAA